ncbi:hypothetical protein EW145_g4482 [Phellinidium pouzarii]|uniref:Uncharacterized protein n=1 Tax=Phellinidium pouzarii TaxID=167371 RepID=A0A4S4L567_9AGAM|nr:hypothetical protein EW145_g4482 [Phellinidium pouzarii]
MRIASGTSDPGNDTILPLLEEQANNTPVMIANRGVGMVSRPKTEPSRPPTAMLNWRILTTLPNFDDEDSSSERLPRELEGQTAAALEEPSSIRLVDASRRSASLPPIPGSVSEEYKPSNPSRSAAPILSAASPVSPLISAFQRALTPSSDFTRTNSGSTFHYPSLGSPSVSSRNALHSTDVLVKSATEGSAQSCSASFVPKLHVSSGLDSEQSGKALLPSNETWLNKSPMPPIPESLRSGGSMSSLGHTSSSLTNPTATPKARLRESQGSTGPSFIQHGPYGDTGTTLSRSNTQHTEHSSVAEHDRRLSTTTQATFGRPGQAESFSPPFSPTSIFVPSPASAVQGSMRHQVREGARSLPELDAHLAVPDDLTKPNSRRLTFELAREPSPPLTTSPLSHPPVLPALRSGSSPRPIPPTQLETTPPQRISVTRPLPLPQSPQEAEIDPYAENEDASSSSEHLLLPSSEIPHPELPGLRPLSPFTFDFHSRESSRSPSRSGKRKEDPSGHSKETSKTSTASGSHKSPGSKRSLKSLASAISSRSRSGSRERPKNRRVTFGDEPLPQVLLPDGSLKSNRSASVSGEGVDADIPESEGQPRRPLPSIPFLPPPPLSLRPRPA